jgi:predicted house-cleaning NTP pyrophosphatase (Maf/HAM1 superfamily)
MVRSKSKHPKLNRSKLRSIFTSYGHFYQLKLNDGISIQCRSVLEIVSSARDDLNDLSNLSSLNPDAIIIMMNPGGSEPIYKEYNKDDIILASDHIISFEGKTLEKATPDETQDRIMNIMNVMKWTHTRILNLSDIREKNSNVLKSRMSNFQGSAEADIHSLFSTTREKERKQAMANEVSHCFILGWGVMSCLHAIAAEALAYLKCDPSKKIFGLVQEEPNYYHPGRAKNWHDQIIDQLVRL